MSAHLAIALTVAFAMIVNARVVIARSASMLPYEMMKNMEAERPNKMVNPMIAFGQFTMFKWINFTPK